jgi:hypothetical protein
LESGAKAKQQKKTPAGNYLLFSGVLFSLLVMVKAKKYQKRNPLANARFSSKFSDKVTCEEFA